MPARRSARGQALDLVRAVGPLLQFALFGLPDGGGRGFDGEFVLDDGVGVRVVRAAVGEQSVVDLHPMRGPAHLAGVGHEPFHQLRSVELVGLERLFVFQKPLSFRT
ncbi:hypothetical protein [Streptomyces sp. 8N706]|uniref:hypothetical protein n=1 Tax=Streptomyces sp. 8N706 TaxID=3457416 RepID=UPI003FD66CE0